MSVFIMFHLGVLKLSQLNLILVLRFVLLVFFVIVNSLGIFLGFLMVGLLNLCTRGVRMNKYAKFVDRYNKNENNV